MKAAPFCILSLLLVASLPCFGSNYTITFTGSGASTVVESVIVQNITQNTSVTVPAGNDLNLTDEATSLDFLSSTNESIRIYSNTNGKLSLMFFAKQTGNAQINAFGMDGRKIVGTSANLHAGSNSFQLALPKGVFVIQATGNGYSYSAKIINKTGTQGNAEIVYNGTTGTPASLSRQKVINSGTTSMQYTAGDQLIYKGVSGNYSTIVTDVPTESKTTNFNFMACTDGDGNNYTAVTIGTQTWMVENLKTTRYRDGHSIAYVADYNAWAGLSTGAWCEYNNNATNGAKYGKLYNWYAVADSRNIAPTGWHVPTDAEWLTLTTYLGGEAVAGGKLKESGTLNWTSPNAGASNETGFSALPGGYRVNGNGAFGYLGNYGYWWSSTQFSSTGAWGRYMDYSNGSVTRFYNFIKTCGFSVRCVKD